MSKKRASTAHRWFPSFNFSEAIALLKAGHKLTRSGWNGRHYIEMQLPDRNSANTLPYLFIVTEKGERVPWVASQADLLSSDWQLR